MRGGVGPGWIFWVVTALGVAACSEAARTSPSTPGTAGGAGHAGASAGVADTAGDAGSPPGSGGTPASGTGGASASGGETATAGSAALGGGTTGGSAGVGGGQSGGLGGTDGAGMAGAIGDSGGGGASGGGGEVGACEFVVTHAASAAIGTVRIVSWSVALPNLNEARIEFGLTNSGLGMTAPVDLAEPEHRTLLLGMKAQRSYSFRIVASDGATTCTSAEFSFTTGALPSAAPVIMKSTAREGGFEGFFVTSPGVASLGASEGHPDAYVFDTDGDLVWWSPTTLREISRARMSWDAKAIWSVRAPGGSVFRSVSMDGSTTAQVSGIERAHHDFAPLPNGGIAAIAYDADLDRDWITELGADGSVTPIADIAELLEPPSSGAYHPNALRYHPEDDSFTLSDLNTNAFVKVTRSGELVWQLGGVTPKGPSFSLVELEPWFANHGHDVRADGRFIFFTNGRTGEADSKILELRLDESSWTATKTWEYADGAVTYFLGDVAYLPNGNALVTYSNAGLIQEVDPSGVVVQSFQGTTFGYVEFRTSLYGPPLH